MANNIKAHSRNMLRYMEFIALTIAYLLSSILYYYSNTLSGLILIYCAFWVFANNIYLNKTILDLYSLFISSWFLTFGLAMLKLLEYQKQWKIEFLFVTYLGILSLVIGLFLGKKIKISTKKTRVNFHYGFLTVITATLIAMVMSVLSYRSTGIIPILAKYVNAYHDHYTRYYVIQVGMLPSAGLAYYLLKQFKTTKTQKTVLIFIIIVHLLILPFLYVNRGIMVISFFFSLPIIYFYTKNKKKFLKVIGVIFIIALFAITSFRSYSDEEVKFFFKPKPIIFMNNQYELPNNLAMLYCYTTISHDNFNHNLEEIYQYSYGGRLLTPLEVFIRTDYFSDLREQNKLENISFALNTHNLMGIIYYDFGIIGMVIILLVYGVVFGLIEKQFYKCSNPFIALTYGGVIIVVALGFFSAWMTQFTLWMWWGTTFLFWLPQLKSKGGSS